MAKKVGNKKPKQKIITCKLNRKIMSNKKQTAVDFAFEKLANQKLLVTRDYKNLLAYREAKEMEMHQVIESFDKGTMLWDSETEGWDYYKENFEQ